MVFKIFKATLVFFAFLSISGSALSETYVKGYTKSDGTYVQPHYRSSPNSSYNDNWSVRGNQNPYTGSYGTKPQTWNDKTPSYNMNSYGYPNYK